MVSSQLLKFLIAPSNLFALRGAKKQVFDLLRHRDGCLVRQPQVFGCNSFQAPLTTSPLTYLNDSRFLGLWHGHFLDMRSLRSVSLWKYPAVYFFSGKPVAGAIGFVVMAPRYPHDTLSSSLCLAFLILG